MAGTPKCLVVISLLPLVLSGSLNDVEHIVIFMQENRAFDHYYGSLQGVRGFNDRTAISLPSGRPAFYQPTNQANLSDYMLPFHVDTHTTSAICMDAPAMNYPTDIGIWDAGLYDAWNTARDPGLGMSYFQRADLPFYYTLADNFIIGDQYFQSTFTETNPNRLHLFSGSNGLSVGHYPVLNNTEPDPGWRWITMAEVLEKANISWRVYQQPDNFDDNGFAWFESFMTAQPGNPLYDKGMTRQWDLVQAFANDINAGTLPQVSWIVGPTNMSEHADNHPAAGEDLTARLLKVLSANATVYAKTVFILNYDEGGQFFDHHWTPTPPLSSTNGVSTVTTVGEVTDAGKPIGLGFRVPLMIISPWTRGNAVVSEVFDHTSVIRLVEERFNVECPNISPWRRAVTGDLLSAFNFDSPDYSWPQLPDTSRYIVDADIECDTLPPPHVPTNQTVPAQEPGVRISRALPYEFWAAGRTQPGDAKHFYLDIGNTGKAGAAFVAFDLLVPTNAPHQYAVEAGKSITDAWTLASESGAYSFALHGPNGFVRVFNGSAGAVTWSGPVPSVALIYNVANVSVSIQLVNAGTAPTTFSVGWNAYRSGAPVAVTVNPKQTEILNWPVSASGNWYDISVTATSPLLGGFARRYMGRMETGVDTTSDPAMGNALHPYVPPRCHPANRDKYCPLNPAVKV
eukprot:TRINITY_DN22675_c0_g1_i2.p1 TRINITY_DN22675_c0_g1~~TRINITY_DN22675_c0_g1_i2.p1  ORF type:complete len:683 (+),score=260.03 TRINITY_DN22675_c0_g1_i2:82-2130(+)